MSMRVWGRPGGVAEAESEPKATRVSVRPVADPRRESRQFITHNIVAAAGTGLAGVMGLLLQAMVSHHFRPAEFGAAFAVFTFFTVLTQPSAGISRMIAWNTSRELATRSSSTVGSSTLLRATNNNLLVGGSILALAFIVAAPLVGGFLHVSSSLVILGALGVPFMFATSPLLASLQGQERWLPWSWLSFAMAASRVVFVFLFVIFFGINGVLLGITVAGAAVYLMALVMVWPTLMQGTGRVDWRPQRNFLIVASASTVAVALLMGCDVLLVEHFFSAQKGGQFSAVAVTSRALFFAVGSVTSVLFPKVAARQASARSTMPVVVASVGVGLGVGLLGLVGFSLGSSFILRSFAGRAYLGGADYIGLYALGMPLLASVVMLSNSLQSLADLRLLWVLIPGGLLKPVLIVFFHGSLLQVAAVSDISIAILFVALAITYVIQERRRLARSRPPGEGALFAVADPVAGAVAIAAATASLPLAEPELEPAPEPVPVLATALAPATVTAAREPALAPAPNRSSLFGQLSRMRSPTIHPPQLSSVLDPAWWRRRAGLLDRPKAVIFSLAVLGVAVRHAWLSTVPLSAGDWHWPDRQRLLEYFPWPSIWDSTLGLGGENRFVASFRFPVYFVSGLLAHLGATWTFIEQFLYFIPVAVLLPVAGWLLSREIMGKTRWALLTPLILLGSTYFTLESDGEVPLTLAEVVSMLALIAFLRVMRRRSIGWAVILGLLVGVVAAFDIRAAYLSVGLMAMYFIVMLVVERRWTVIRQRVLLGAVAGAVFLGSQLFWLIPLLTYHGNPGFPTPQAPDFNILTLGHGLTGVSAFWTGGQPAQLVQAPLNPMYMILPLLALTPLLARRLRPEVVWLTAAALLFAFFAKTDSPPLGALYDWMYLHIPGWKLFREGSKFLYIVALAYAILIPIALSAAFEWVRSRPRSASRTAVHAGAALALVAVVALSCSTVAVLESGSLNSTTVGTPEPSSFSALSSVIAGDSRPGAILWFGQPVLNDTATNHHFLIASSIHPTVDLTGNFTSTKINQRDPFQLYCADNLVPYCYVDPALFPYLAQMSGAGYVVVPQGLRAGTLPIGVTRPWITDRMQAMFGAPSVLGSGDTALLVWRLPSPLPTVTSAPAIALVDGGTWSTPAVLPALRALGVPAAYRQSFDSKLFPVAPTSLQDAVRVLPRTDGSCLGSGGSVAVMAQSGAPSIDLTVAGAAQSLPLLTAASRVPGWGVYGPVSMTGTSLAISSAAPGLTLGPCLAWSSLAAATLADHSDPVSGTVVGGNGETVTASSTGSVGSWIELRRYFDPGWTLDGRKPTTLGDGLFNMYHLDAAQASAAKLNFAFSTSPWETVGQVVAVLVVVVAVLVVVRDRRRRRNSPTAADTERLPDLVPSPAARWIAGLGLAVLGVAAVAVTLEWFGVPSAVPALSFASDPYATDVGYGAVAVAILLVSLAVRVVAQIARSGRAPSDEKPSDQKKTRVSARMGVAATLVIGLVVLTTACGNTDPGALQNLLTEAQQAGSVAPTIEGASLDDARLQRVARQPDLCIADYTQALQDFPDLASAYTGRGDCYLNGGQNGPAAVRDYSQAISLTPDSADLYLRRAVADRVSGNVSAAIADYQQAATIPSANASVLLTAVGGLIRLNQLNAASTIYTLAIALQPQAALLHVAAATIATARGQDQLADQEFATAERLAANKSETATVLAHVCHAEVLRQNYTRAASDCAEAAKLSGSGSGSEDDLSAAELGLGSPSAALVAINASISSFISNVGPYAQPSGVDGFGLARLYSARAWIDIQLGQKSSAVSDFQAALDALPPGSGPDERARIQGYIVTAKAD
jgi:O-antigen/teichoic acid export membrane protein/tetratricopeptide (TPR) repeat protein